MRARILECKPERYELTLTTRQKDLKDANGRFALMLDEPFRFNSYMYQEGKMGKHPDDEQYISRQRKKTQRARFKARTIQHILFKNFSRTEAVEYLRKCKAVSL